MRICRVTKASRPLLPSSLLRLLREGGALGFAAVLLIMFDAAQLGGLPHPCVRGRNNGSAPNSHFGPSFHCHFPISYIARPARPHNTPAPISKSRARAMKMRDRRRGTRERKREEGEGSVRKGAWGLRAKTVHLHFLPWKKSSGYRGFSVLWR